MLVLTKQHGCAYEVAGYSLASHVGVFRELVLRPSPQTYETAN